MERMIVSEKRPGFIEGKHVTVIVGKLEEGEDLMGGIQRVVKDANVRSGAFMLTGALEKAHVAFLKDDRKYHADHQMDGPFEIASCTGNVAMKDGDPVVHCHMTAVARDGRMIAGHLVEGSTIKVTGELTIFRFDDVQLNRKYDGRYNANLLDIQ